MSTLCRVVDAHRFVKLSVAVASPGFCVRGHGFGVVKRPKIINVCRTTPGSTVYSRVCVIALGLCVSFTYNNKIKIHDRPSLKKLPIPGNNKSSADADKPARRFCWSVKVIKHGTIRCVMYGFQLVCYDNFVRF